jgi:hypothetical protein
MIHVLLRALSAAARFQKEIKARLREPIWIQKPNDFLRRQATADSQAE